MQSSSSLKRLVFNRYSAGILVLGLLLLMPAFSRADDFTYAYTYTNGNEVISWTTDSIPGVTTNDFIPVSDLSADSVTGRPGCSITQVEIDGATGGILTDYNYPTCSITDTAGDQFPTADFLSAGMYTATYETQTETLTVTETPEPATVILMLIGIGLLFIVGKRISLGHQHAG
ncbi:MAG: PEP-CTERM sorting domain-containing protein [Candidatus Acidiferrales bacterium]